MRHVITILVLLICGIAPAQNYEAAVKRRLNEQHNNAEDKAYFNKRFGPSIKVLSISKPIDLDQCEINSIARQCRDPKHAEVWALMKADAAKAGLSEVHSDTVNIKDTSPTEWSAVGIKGKAIRVKYERIRGGNDAYPQANNRRLLGIANPTNDRTFLLDHKGVIFAEFDSEHLRVKGEPLTPAQQMAADMADKIKSQQDASRKAEAEIAQQSKTSGFTFDPKKAGMPGDRPRPGIDPEAPPAGAKPDSPFVPATPSPFGPNLQPLDLNNGLPKPTQPPGKAN